MAIDQKMQKKTEEKTGVLMQANGMLKYRNKIIGALKDGTLLSKHLKTSDDAALYHMLEDVKDFIQKIKLIAEKINLSLFEDFFESSSPADYTKKLINTSSDENKEIEEEMKNKMSNLKDRMKEMSEKEKKYKNADETLEIIKKILDYNKNAPKYFQLASKVDKKKKKNQNQRLKKVLQKG